MSQSSLLIEFSLSRRVYSYADFSHNFSENIHQEQLLKQLARDFSAKAFDFSREKWLDRALNIIPLVGIVRSGKYTKADLKCDLISGLVSCMFHIPQGLAYGFLASLKPVNGLYTSLIPVFIYALFGRSRHLSVGTFALMSVLLSDIVASSYKLYLPRIQASNVSLPLNYTDVEYAKLQTVIVSSFAISIVFLCIGLLRLGFIMRYVSDAMFYGFSAGAAAHVLVSQFPLLFGVSTNRSDNQFRIAGNIMNLSQAISSTNFVTLSLSVGVMATLFLAKEYINPLVKKKILVPLPLELIIIIISVLAVEFTGLSRDLKVAVFVADVPRGFPAPIVPDIGFLPTVFPPAIPVGLVGAAITMSLGKLYCLQFGYKYHVNEDFTILGISSLTSCFFQGTFACAAPVRNAAVVSSGMKTQISSLISCLGVLLFLEAVGPYFNSIPTFIFGSIVVVTMANIIRQLVELPQIWKVSRMDSAIWLVSFMSVLVLNVTMGLAVGFGFTVLSVVLRSQLPPIAILGQVGDTGIYKNVLVYPAAKEVPGVKIVRFDAPLNFTNAEHFYNYVDDLAVGLKLSKSDSQADTPVHTIVLDCSPWTYVDMVGGKFLKMTHLSLSKLGYRVVFAACTEPVQACLALQDFFKHVDKSLFFVSLHDATLFAITVPPPLVVASGNGNSLSTVNRVIGIGGLDNNNFTPECEDCAVTMDTRL